MNRPATPVTCVRAGISMTREQWYALPLALRQRYWQDTDWGKQAASLDMVAEVQAALAQAGKLDPDADCKAAKP